jgi:hypothetical protein
MSRLTREELDGMRQLATMGYVPFWGTIDAERDEDFEITLRRSQIADYQTALLRAVEEIERCCERLPPE